MHPLDFVSGFRGPAALLVFPSVFSQGLAVGFWTCDWEGPSVRGKTSRAPAQVQLISSEVETVSVWPQFLPRVQFLLLLPAYGSCNADGAVRWKQSAPPHTSAQLSETLACFPNSGRKRKILKKIRCLMRTPHMAPMPRGKRREDGPLPRRHVPIALEI